MSIPKLEAVNSYDLVGPYIECDGETNRPVIRSAPADSISISLEFLRGAEAAAKWAHDNYEEPEWMDIADAAISAEVARLRAEAAK